MLPKDLRARATVPASDLVEPLGTVDLTMLASDCGPAPMHLGAVLVLDGADDGRTTVVDTFVGRAGAVPRLTQVLVGPRRRSERPAWWRDPEADPAAQVQSRRLPGGGEQAVLDAAADLVCTPLDPARPLWSALWLTGWDTTSARRAALAVVLHHVLVDGVGGLGVLQALADPDDDAAAPASVPVATSPPTRGPRAWLHGLLELGLGAGLPAVAARTSLNRPTGPRRRVAVVRVGLGEFRDGAHRHGGSVNDAMVAAVVGALAQQLAAHDEHPRRLVVSVPVNGRAAGDRGAGNQNGVLAVAVPTRADVGQRVRHVAAATARLRARPRGASALPLGAAFRAIAAIGLFRSFVEHQRLVHTFVTNVRGPVRRMRFAGHDVSAVLPLAVNPGNVGASFDVLSYAGELAVTVVIDPGIVPQPAELARLLAAEIHSVVAN